MANQALTEYGKEVRKLRIEAGVFLADHAKFVGKSPSLLSGIEVGRTKISPEVLDKTISFFKNYNVDANCLREWASWSTNVLELNWGDYPLQDKKLFQSFAEKFPKLSEEQKRKLELFFSEIEAK